MLLAAANLSPFHILARGKVGDLRRPLGLRSQSDEKAGDESSGYFEHMKGGRLATSPLRFPEKIKLPAR